MQRRTAALVVSLAAGLLAAAGAEAAEADSTPLGPRREPGYFEFSEEDTRGHQEVDENGEARFLFSSTSLSVTNSTLIRAISAIIGALLLALPLYLAYATHVGGQSSGYGYGYASTGYGSSGRRFQRSASEPEDQQDLLNRLSLLVESSLRRHGDDLGMTEDGLCEALAACEAGAIAAAENSTRASASIVSAPIRLHKLLSLSVLLDRDAVSSSVYLNGLLSAHAAGHAGDSCGRYKSECLVASI